jgi:hypothetical protein
MLSPVESLPDNSIPSDHQRTNRYLAAFCSLVGEIERSKHELFMISCHIPYLSRHLKSHQP